MTDKPTSGAPTVTATVDGVPYSCETGTVLEAFLAGCGAGVPTPCGGHGKCGKCRVTVSGAVSPPTERERKILSPEEIGAGVRLACQVTAEGDCAVSLPKEQGKAQIRGEGSLPAYVPEPVFSRCGAAVDIGTTTLAARLYAPDGTLLAADARLNPESVWGADVISRMEACLAGHAGEIAVCIRQAVDGMLAEMTRDAGIAPDEIDAAVVTGNTVMLHLLTGKDVEPMTHAPFHATSLFGMTVTAGDLEFGSLRPDTPVYLPPCAAAFVGADMLCSLLASEVAHKSGTRLLVDIGTNGEMILSHGGKLLACSTAAGPAFEGAGISMGMGGRDGAVDRVRVEDGELKAHVLGEKDPVGICGSGLVDAVACLLETEALDETGFLEDDPAVIVPPVELTQEDIRMVQLAKSAIHAGMRTLLRTAEVECGTVEELAVAGGFGSYLDIGSAIAIGLLPEEMRGRVRILGNAALAGASMLLLSKGLRKEAEELSRSMEIVSLAANPVFASEYMERMMF